MCREAIDKKSELGKKVEPYIKAGKLVPDNLMIEVINKRLQQKDALDHGVLLDGYPRTNNQALELVKNDSINIDRVILIQTPDEVCIKRVLGRRVDPLTSKTYNIFFDEFSPPNNEIRDRVLKREADVDRRYVKGRLTNYHKQLGSVLQHFRGKIFSVNGDKQFHEVR